MLAYTFGIPFSIFAFLLVGALVGTNAPDPSAGLMPGLIAAGVVFALCMKGQIGADKALENPDTFVVNCSPERAFSAVHECLMLSSHGEHYWSIQTLQNTLRIIGTMKFDEQGAGGEKPVTLKRHVRLLVSISTNAAGKTVVKPVFTVHSEQGRWTCDKVIAETTSALKRELMCA
jgi:hypothetical protein